MNLIGLINNETSVKRDFAVVWSVLHLCFVARQDKVVAFYSNLMNLHFLNGGSIIAVDVLLSTIECCISFLLSIGAVYGPVLSPYNCINW